MSRIITPAQLRRMSLHELHTLCHALASETAHSAAERSRIEIALALVRREIALRHLPRPGL
jgi:hypothetical protein